MSCARCNPGTDDDDDDDDDAVAPFPGLLRLAPVSRGVKGKYSVADIVGAATLCAWWCGSLRVMSPVMEL